MCDKTPYCLSLCCPPSAAALLLSVFPLSVESLDLTLYCLQILCTASCHCAKMNSRDGTAWLLKMCFFVLFYPQVVQHVLFIR